MMMVDDCFLISNQIWQTNLAKFSSFLDQQCGAADVLHTPKCPGEFMIAPLKKQVISAFVAYNSTVVVNGVWMKS